MIPAAGHAVNIDQPQAFIDAVLPFLDSLPRSTATEQRCVMISDQNQRSPTSTVSPGPSDVPSGTT